MGLEDLKRWHWAIIGIIVGLAIAYARTGVEPSGEYSIGVAKFSQEVGADDLPGGHFRIENVILHPPCDPSESAYKKSVQIVTFREAVYDQKRQGWVYKPAAMKIELPFKGPNGEDYGGSFEKYMDALKADNPKVAYSFAWWEKGNTQYMMWAAGCLLIVGGAWPTVINLLVGAGFGAPKKKDDYDLSRFGKSKEAAPQPTARRAMTSEEQAQLSRLTQNLESDLAPSGNRSTVGVAEAGTDQPVRKLENKPLEIANIEQEKEDKEYKGEFYPVAKQGHKNEEKH